MHQKCIILGKSVTYSEWFSVSKMIVLGMFIQTSDQMGQLNENSLSAL